MESILRREDRIVFGLRALYSKYGYRPYRMSKFEEYDLYAGNRSFLPSGGVITFTDTNGRLMALKPDVTLSIAKNLGGGPEAAPEKLYYDESVYRAPGFGPGLSGDNAGGPGISGPGGRLRHGRGGDAGGAEPGGDIRGLGAGSVAHGLSDGPGGRAGAQRPGAGGAAARRGQPERAGGVGRLSSAGAPMSAAERLASLLELYGPAQELLPRLRAGAATAAELAAVEELEGTARVLESFGCLGGVNIDLSITCDTEYYNGLVFKGYVPGAPSAVLSGGATTA